MLNMLQKIWSYILEYIEEMNHLIITVMVVLISIVIMVMMLRKAVYPYLIQTLDRRDPKYSNVCGKYNVFTFLTHCIVAIYLAFWSGIFNHTHLLLPVTLHIKNVAVNCYIIISFTLFLLSVLNALTYLHRRGSVFGKLPVSLCSNIAKITLFCCAFLAMFANIFSLSFASMFASIGATAAVLGIVFKDPLVGLFASIQLTAEDIIRVGDSIKVPQFNADGTVETITVSVIKIRNSDQTISVIPTTSLLGAGFTNSRGIHEASARRIKRSVLINMNTIHFASSTELEEFSRMPLLKNFFKANPQIFNAKKSAQQITNIEIFINYLNAYLQSQDHLHTEDFPVIARQLEPSSVGLPIEIYAYCQKTDLATYESIQSRIISHLIAILPEFGLAILQQD